MKRPILHPVFDLCHLCQIHKLVKKEEPVDEDNDLDVIKVVRPNPAKKRVARVKVEPEPEEEIAPTPLRRSTRSRRVVRLHTPVAP
ncbi:hypothetical protein PRIPAC_89325 [Pristionchus pacificus]|uniref:Uncharacterized protein n=1 Tax=Pristionchus pacificus TaxID=54126 RepID=A0A2A6CVZ8_PRIPA|nr:hypothetical protein PRIPAC_89325 [Pristionchus pacificus]|eukprot:PDM82308.1 hypothetical protein PRIPAC_36701 [Pristionchus pacificus]